MSAKETKGTNIAWHNATFDADGEIPYATGNSAPYETPSLPGILSNKDKNSVEECVIQVINQLIEHDVIKTYVAPAAVSIDIA